MLRFVQLYVMAPAKRTLDCSHRNYLLAYSNVRIWGPISH